MAKNNISIGRSGTCDIKIDSVWDVVSNQHANLELRGQKLYYIDHSTNGSYVNGQGVHHTEVEVKFGDVILLAGKCPLDWAAVEAFIPRPVAPQPQAFQQSKPVQTFQQPRPVQQFQQPRPVQQFNQPAPQQFQQPQPVVQPAPQLVVQPASQPVVQPSPQPVNQPQFPGSSAASGHANGPASGIASKIDSWNWGAFLGSFVWAACHKKLWPLVMIPLAVIPYLGQVANLWISSYLGYNGYKIAWRSGKYKNYDALAKASSTWLAIGIVVFIAFVAASIFALRFTIDLI